MSVSSPASSTPTQVIACRFSITTNRSITPHAALTPIQAESSTYLERDFIFIPLRCRTLSIEPGCAFGSLMPELNQTSNGDFEPIDYHVFKPAGHDRYMEWEAGDGRVAAGVEVLTPQKTDAKTEAPVLLPTGQSVLVMNMKFKLVPKT
ncbi:hypothetical protein V496_02559 [Pseudogymnoascus sp. VKM F-4515 (FW-2607)]|nr:hypothetical protein V496_02559 [Pseudogymnoascus sp. VKM F-4515 (FW-2607)]